MFVELTRREAVPLILVHQPNLDVSTKALFGLEKVRMIYGLRAYFAMPAAEVDTVSRIETYRADQANCRDHVLYAQAFHDHANAVRELAAQHSLGYVDAQAVVDSDDRLPVFYDAVHLTAAANRRLGDAVATKVDRVLAQHGSLTARQQ